jgi:hypothetical protein
VKRRPQPTNKRRTPKKSIPKWTPELTAEERLILAQEDPIPKAISWMPIPITKNVSSALSAVADPKHGNENNSLLNSKVNDIVNNNDKEDETDNENMVNISNDENENNNEMNKNFLGVYCDEHVESSPGLFNSHAL